MRLLHTVLASALSLTLLGCGAESVTPPAASAQVVPPAGAYISRKPNPQLGTLAARVVERPSVDRVVIEATWTLREGASACEIHLILPPAATLLEGEGAASLGGASPTDASPTGTSQGDARWVVAIPASPGGGALDAVVRLCGTEADAFRSREVAVRLTGS